MDKKQMKVFGVACLVICAVCVFVAVERYNANAGNVRAMNALRQSSPLENMMGGPMEPATPAATKYALLFAAISGVGGAVLLVKSGRKES